MGKPELFLLSVMKSSKEALLMGWFCCNFPYTSQFINKNNFANVQPGGFCIPLEIGMAFCPAKCI